jgi:Rhodopirellula transposase DDE domain
LRVHRKSIASNSSRDRNQQFQYIGSLRTRFERQGLPIVSVDSTKRGMIGNVKQAGAKWDRAPVAVNDHDFLSDVDSVALPYGIYDPVVNRGMVSVGFSHDTSAFAAHSIACCWKREGSVHYRNASRLLIQADAGGSNSYNRWT